MDVNQTSRWNFAVNLQRISNGIKSNQNGRYSLFNIQNITEISWYNNSKKHIKNTHLIPPQNHTNNAYQNTKKTEEILLGRRASLQNGGR